MTHFKFSGRRTLEDAEDAVLKHQRKTPYIMLDPVALPSASGTAFSPISKHIIPDVPSWDANFNVPRQPVRFEDALEVEGHSQFSSFVSTPMLTSYVGALDASPNDQEVDDALRHIEGFTSSRVLVEAVSMGFGTPKHACWCVRV